MPKAVGACLSCCARPHHPAPRRPGRATWVRGRPPRRSWSTRSAGADEAGSPLLRRSAGGSNLVVADEGFPGTVVARGHPRGRGRRRRLRHPGRVRRGDRPRRRRRDLGRPASPAPWPQQLGRRRGALRHPRLRSARPRSRTSAPTARRSPRPSPRCASGTASSGRRGPSPPPTAASATAPAGSRPSPDRHVVLEVDLPAAAGQPRRAGAVRRAGPHPRRRAGGRAPLADVREAVLGLRRGKGMVLDPADHDTWSAGSFFTNPVLDADGPPPCPPTRRAWPQPDGTVKTSAAWLIEHAGFAKGYGAGPGEPVHQAHAGAHQPRRAPPPTTCSRSPREVARRGRAALRRSGWSTSRCWSAAPCELALSTVRGAAGRQRHRDARKHDQPEQRRGPSRTVPMMPMT